MKITNRHIRNFRTKVFAFYKTRGRDLPWRKTTDPYKILISEFMLQQTQVSRVIEYFGKWIKLWPTINHLARATRSEVLMAWMGLGYNTRAVNLHRAAKIIIKDYDSNVLEAVECYKEIAGIGEYTSRAVRIFAANADLVTVDTNIRRILIHEFRLSEDISGGALLSIAERCLPKGRSRKWHNALMDYGALYLTGTKTGIRPKTQQSTFFKGSDRQIRAHILRTLLLQTSSLSELYNTCSVEEKRLLRILDKMVHEQLIAIRNKRYQLKE